MAMLQPFYMNGDWNRTAAAQQLAVIKCLYQDTRPLVVGLLQSDGQILTWNHQPSSWPPSYCVIRTNDGQVWVMIAGTTNFTQGALHIYGSFGMQLQGGGFVHGQWVDAYDRIAPDVEAAIGGVVPAAGLNFAGHSYGGALALIGAVTVIGQRGAKERVRVMSFGAPRAYSNGTTLTFPDLNARIIAPEDAITALPPAGLYLGSKWDSDKPLDWQDAFVSWRHFGEQSVMNATGGPEYSQKPPNPLPAGVETGYISSHRSNSYAGRLNQYRLNFGTNGDFETALAVFAAASESGTEQLPVYDLPRIVHGPNGELVVIPGYFGIPENRFIGLGANMAYPAALTGGEAWRITFLINQGIAGYSEETTWYLTGTIPDKMDKLKNLAALLAGIRKTVLVNKATIVGVRIGEAKAGGASFLWADAAAGAGVGQVATKPTQASDCLQLKYADPTGVARTVNYFRGWAEADLLLDSNGNNRNVAYSAACSAFVTAWRTRLLTPYTSFGGIAVACVKTYQRDPAIEGIYEVTGFTLDANGYLVLTFNGTNEQEWSVNDMVHVKPTLTQCTKGIAGDAKVIKVDVVAGNSVITLRKKIPCYAAQLLGLTGTAQRKTTIYAAMSVVHGSYTGDRQSGGPFGQGRGRAAKRSC